MNERDLPKEPKKKRPAKKAAKKKRPAKLRGMREGMRIADLGTADIEVGRKVGRHEVSLQVRMPAKMRAALVKEAAKAKLTAGAILRDAASMWLASRGIDVSTWTQAQDPRQLSLAVST